MATTTLTVTVYGGLAPENINVSFYKDGEEIPTNAFSNNGSFTKTYSGLNPGIYDIFITGVNPFNPAAATKCELTTDEITLHPPDDTPVIKKGKMYLVQFNFTV